MVFIARALGRHCVSEVEVNFWCGVIKRVGGFRRGMVITTHTQTEKGNKVELAAFPNTKENRNKVQLGALL